MSDAAAEQQTPQPVELTADELTARQVIHNEIGMVRSLAVEIVDQVRGHTYEFSNAPAGHLADYDWVEDRISEVLAEIRANRKRRPDGAE